MVKWKKIFTILLFILIFIKCDPEYHPYYIENNRSLQLNEKNIRRIINEAGDKDTLVIPFISDTQRALDETLDIVEYINKNINADFVIHGGDITDFGLEREYEWMHEVLQQLNAPLVTVAGNHDILGNGETIYQSYYGDLNYSFKVNNVQFILMNTNSREYQFNGKIPDINWLNNEIDTTAKGIVLVVHISPVDPDFDRELESKFIELMDYYPVLGLIHGHVHSYKVYNIGTGEIPAVQAPTTRKKKFVLLKISEDSMHYEEIKIN